jgi:16S rRNA (adenine1518-N6/adenine1519-N6)-dimethyltransferase
LINYDSPQALRAFLAERGLGIRKKFGQNFLINPGLRKALADALAPEGGEEVWEVGPGLGAMTCLLLERGLRVKAFEIDPGFCGILREIFREERNFCLIEGDVLKTWTGQDEAPCLLGNLPYNIGAVLLADFIEKGRFFKRMVVTVQKEVARRMAAPPGSADYSSFSVLCASAYRVRPLMTIRGASFYPAPRVDSQGLCLSLKEPARVYPKNFYPLVRHLFSSRRKTVKNNLRRFLGGNEELARSLLDESGISGEERAENLDIEVFAALAERLETAGGVYGNFR